MDSANPTPPLLVPPKEAARLMGCSVRKLWSMTFEETPTLPYVRVGRLVRYTPRDLAAFIDARRQGGAQ